MRTVLRQKPSTGAVMAAQLIASMLFVGLLVVMVVTAGTAPAAASEVANCTYLDGVWDEATDTCTVDEIWLDGWGLHVPMTMTLAVTGNFTNAATIIGPGPGVLTIDDVVVDGHLIISGTATNYGPVYVNGHLTIAGDWYDGGEFRDVWDEIRHIWVDSSAIGHITNDGALTSLGYAGFSFGLTNRGVWTNTGDVHAGGVVRNRGSMTHTGTLTITGQLLNQGNAHMPGGLTNQGEVWNWGVLSGSIANHGPLYNFGVLSATVTGDGPVYILDHNSYLPLVTPR